MIARRDIRVMALVGTAHFFSHFFQLALPSLFPLMREELGLSYTELGLAVSIFFVFSAFAQVIAGVLVDRHGPQIVLPVGLGCLSAAIGVAGFVSSYEALLGSAALAGLGNSVFHPSDFAIMNARVSPSRLGRAYSVHTICGTLGWAAAPLTMLIVAHQIDWHNALMLVGTLGLAVAVLIGASHRYTTVSIAASRLRSHDRNDWRRLLNSPILPCFCYFTLLSIAQGGLQNFLPTLLPLVQDIGLTGAATATTLFLLGSATGSLAGGYLADLTSNHDRVVATGLGAAALLTLTLGFVALPVPALMIVAGSAGFLFGVTIPARDMLARSATPAGATGTVFGFVYSGADLGIVLAPLAITPLLDLGTPQSAFGIIALALLATMASAFFVKQQASAAHGSPSPEPTR